MNQPIHTTIKPAVKAAPERFELTWEMIEYFKSASVFVRASTFDVALTKEQPSSLQAVVDTAVALEIVLQCRTFSPGVFERKENGVWQRAGETQKHDNAEGC